jgi:hypothetical protein
MSINIEQETAEMILLPRHPTKAMIEAAYYAALNEDAEGVWEKMIEAWIQESLGNLSKGNC